MIKPCFALAALLVSIALFSSARADAQTPSAPCCGIVAIDANTGIITAKVNATGNVFQFKPNGYSPIDGLRSNPGALASLKPGQVVYANFTNHQVSLDGQRVCCTMTNGPQVALNAGNVLPSKLNHSLGSWTTKAPMRTTQDGAAAGVVNGILYVVGGSGPSGIVATVEAYDPAAPNADNLLSSQLNRSLSWTIKAAMPTARSEATAGVVNGILYVVGGTDRHGYAGAAVEAYDPATNTWTTKAPMLARCYAPVSGVVNGILYVVGDIGATVEAYDPVTNTWTTKAPMYTTQTHVTAGVVNGILYVAGGFDYANRVVATVEAYDPATNRWTTKAPMPTARNSASAGVVNGILYVVGGSSSHGVPLHTVEAYDPATNTWTTKAPMLTARQSAAAGVVDGILYVAGGLSNYGTYSFPPTVEAYQP
jgi:N-acetylneuraminic acid mutarotase